MVKAQNSRVSAAIARLTPASARDETNPSELRERALLDAAKEAAATGHSPGKSPCKKPQTSPSKLRFSPKKLHPHYRTVLKQFKLHVEAVERWSAASRRLSY